MKNKKRSIYSLYFIMYTLVFSIMGITLFYKFWANRISFVWNGDGWAQHIRALQFYSDWLQQIGKNIFFKHKVDIPLWSSTIGYGNDIITTLHYYVIGDPLCLFSVFVPDRYIVHFYDVMVVFRMYLSGLSFSIYCFYRKNNNRIAILTAAVLYSFSAYILVSGFRHPFFINSFIYLPLLLVGIEKILDGKKPLLFILMVFISTVSNFYFMYIIALNAVLYLIVRLFTLYGIKKIGHLFKKLGYMILCAITGVMMGAVILLPILKLFEENTRNSVGQQFRLFYEKNFYDSIPQIILTIRLGAHNTLLALCSLVLFSICLLYMRRKKNTGLKISLIILTIFLLTPIAGKIFNGFSYPSNRWMFSYILLLSYIVVVEWDDLYKMTLGKFVFILIPISALFVYGYHNLGESFKESTYKYMQLIVVGLVLLAMSVVICHSRLKTNKYCLYIMQLAMFGLAVMTVHINVQSKFYSSDITKNKLEFVRMEAVKKDLKSAAGEAVLKASEKEKDFFRYDASASWTERNSTLQSKLNSTSFYWSLTGKWPAQFFSEVALINKGAYNYKNLDGRTFLNEIASTKYYVTSTKKSKKYVIPFGYKKVDDYKIKTAEKMKKCTVFKNKYALPLGYTYNSYYTRDTYEKMNELERQNALLQGVLLEKTYSGYSKTDINQDYSEIPYEIIQYNGVKKNGDGFDVQEKNASIVIKTKKKVNNCEINLSIGNIEAPEVIRVADCDSLSARYGVVTKNSKGEKSSNRFFYFQPGNIYFAGRNYFLANLGYYKDGKQTISLKFPQKGYYKIGTLKIYAQSMDLYPEQVSKLKEDVLENVKIGTNTIQGDINLKKDKILCLSVPYSKGWKATVDGKKEEILQANTMYMALPLKKGKHKIQLIYCTPGLKLGMIVSFIGVCLCIIICTYKKRFK